MNTLVSVLVCLILALGAGSAGAQGPPVKIGLLLPYTGVLSAQGTDTTNGFELYLKRVGSKAGGREIRALKKDDEAKPDVGLTKIKKLVERDIVLLGWERILPAPRAARKARRTL
jgi:branched-chain amino acid transport system substrate-binding protein